MMPRFWLYLSVGFTGTLVTVYRAPVLPARCLSHLVNAIWHRRLRCILRFSCFIAIVVGCQGFVQVVLFCCWLVICHLSRCWSWGGRLQKSLPCERLAELLGK